MRKALLIAFLVVLTAVLVFFPQIRLGVLTALLLKDLLDEPSSSDPNQSALAWVTSSPKVATLEIPHQGRKIAADLYYMPDRKKSAAILLTHGIIEAGKDDPRLARFARSLARTGYAVLVPELAGMKALKVLLSDVGDIVASFRYLVSLKELVNEEKMGLMGFSYAAGPTIMAAADPSIQRQVNFLVSFGGYYEPLEVIRFITTGYYEYRNERGYLKPEPYGKWVFFINNVDHVQSAKDRKLLKQIFEKEREQKRAAVRTDLQRLTPQGRYLYELLINEDPRRVDDLVERIDPRVKSYLDKLSLAPVIPSLKAYMIIGHGNTDPLIPFTESLRLADAVGDKQRVHLAILRLFSHVDPTRSRFSAREYFTVYLPSVAEFYLLVYDLLRQQW